MCAGVKYTYKHIQYTFLKRTAHKMVSPSIHLETSETFLLGKGKASYCPPLVDRVFPRSIDLIMIVFPCVLLLGTHFTKKLCSLDTTGSKGKKL